MKCKKHPSDVSSTVGVCATCLRERLISLIAAQIQIDQAQLASAAGKSDQISPIHRRLGSRRKSDDASHHHNIHGQFDHRFYSTPQVGPTYNAINRATNLTSSRSCRRKSGSAKLSVLSIFFSKTRSNKSISVHNNTDRPTSWLSSIFQRRKKQSRLFTVDDSIGIGQPGFVDRGMSPANNDDNRSPSGSDQTSESSQGWRSTPTAVVAPPSSARRSRPCQAKNVSRLAFCLSPLVRASPNRQHWSQKSGVLVPPEMAYSGEIRGSSKPHLSTAASFCANRSRKVADFGRVNQTR